MRDVELSAAGYRDIAAHAEETHPRECCGVVVRRGDRQEIVRVSNIQDRRHAADPEAVPRTSGEAYTMGSEVVPLMIAHDRRELVIEAIYHSHPYRDANFSAEDRRQAVLWGEPAYPDAAWIVVSTDDQRVKDMRAYRWEPSTHDFLAVPLRVL